MQPRNIRHLIVDIDSITPHPKNVRHGDIGAISESLKAHGQYRPIVVDERTGQILAGNHTWKAAKALNWSQIQASFIETKDDDEATRILLADNKANDLATYNDDELINLLKQLAETDEGLEGTLFDGDDLDALIAEQEHFELPVDVDEIPEQVAAVSKLGDVWLLGDHRVMCGDSTNTTDMNKLMLGKTANMVFTDPPYGVVYQSNMRTKTEKFKVIENDDVILDIVPTIKQFSKGWVFVWTSWKVIAKWLDALSALEYPTNMIIWNKGGGGIGDLKKTFSTDYEIALVWNRAIELTGKRFGSVWDIGKDASSKYVHPTQKPAALGVQAIETTTNRNDIVLDLFGGSGSTLIAAQETNRIAYLMELDPHYVDVICARYQKHTGNQPILEATGEPHNFLPDANS